MYSISVKNISALISFRKLGNFINDQLYINSFFIILTKVLVILMGFVFWTVAARFYTIEQVGLAVALISASNLILMFSMLGFDISIIRFLSTYDKEKVFNTCLMIVILFAALIGIFYILAIKVISPDLSFIQNPAYGTVFLFFVIASSAITITANAFIALRNAKYNFFQNLILASKIPMLIPLVFMGYFGIIGAIALPYVLVCIMLIFTLNKMIRFNFKIDKTFIEKSFKFSSSNYITNLLYCIPIFALPILILNLLGGAEAAKFYIAFTIGNFLHQIPEAIGTSLLVEGSHGRSLRENVIKAMVATYSIQVPGLIAIFLFGTYILGVFGSQYVEALDLLKLIALSSIFYTIFTLFLSVQNVRMRIRSIIKINLLRFAMISVLSYFFITDFGLIGASYVFNVSYALLSLVIIAITIKENWTRTDFQYKKILEKIIAWGS